MLKGYYGDVVYGGYIPDYKRNNGYMSFATDSDYEEYYNAHYSENYNDDYSESIDGETN